MVVLLVVGVDAARRGQRALALVVPLLEVLIVRGIPVAEAIGEDLVDDAVLDPVRRHERRESGAVIGERVGLGARRREALGPEPRTRHAVLILELVLRALGQLHLGAEVIVDAIALDGLHRHARLGATGRPPHEVDARHVIEVGARGQLDEPAADGVDLLRTLLVDDALREHLAVALADLDRGVSLVHVADRVLAAEAIVRLGILAGLILRPAVRADHELVLIGARREQHRRGPLAIAIGIRQGRLTHGPVIERAGHAQRIRLARRAELERHRAQTQLRGIGLLERGALTERERLVLDRGDRVLPAEAVRRGLDRHLVLEPLIAVDHELVLDATRREFDVRRPDAILVGIGERVRRRVPAVEAAGHRDGVHATDDRLVPERHLGGVREPDHEGQEQRGEREDEARARGHGTHAGSPAARRAPRGLNGEGPTRDAPARGHFTVMTEFLPPKSSSCVDGFASSSRHTLPSIRNL